jgi:hypothetical protein
MSLDENQRAPLKFRQKPPFAPHRMLSDRRPPVAPPRPQPRWQLLQDGVLIGTFSEEALCAMIRNGDVLLGSIRPLGETDWYDIKSHATFAKALREAAQTLSMRRP